MNRLCWNRCAALLFALLCLIASPAAADDQKSIPQSEITALQTQLAETKESTSSARKKLGIRRVIRSCEELLEKNAAAPNRFEVLGVLYESQQAQIKLDDSPTNRKAFLDTCRALIQAPDEYAEIRLDAELLLTQAEMAQQGADQQARADALKPLVQRYLGTEVDTKVVRIALTMALEMGDASLIGYLLDVIAEEFPGDLEMINFQRDHLAGQVFGAPFVGTFTSAKDNIYRFPMDGMGKTTALYFWTKEGDGLEQLELLAEGWKQINADPEGNAVDVANRYQFISFNLDGLPDAGESILREMGLDWPAMHLPGGRENPVYQTYVRNDPKLLTMTPTGYTAMVMSGSTRARPDRGWERSFQSMLARVWTQPDITCQMQSLLVGDFLVVDPTGDFDPAAPPEWKAAQAGTGDQTRTLKRTATSVPENKLRAIQTCFIKPPLRYQLPYEQVRANYEKAEALCRLAIAEHPEADDLWIVRNRRIVALMGLWKAEQDRKHYDAALQEANTAIEAGYPAGTDLIARFCLAREALRADDADLTGVIDSFVEASGGASAPAPALAIASLLALEIGERKLHEHYRRALLDQYAEHPMVWSFTAYLLDRTHRYWMYHPPFTAGWTYGRREGYFLTLGTPEDADRSVKLELKTLDGKTVRIPEDAEGKWTILEFVPHATMSPHMIPYSMYWNERPSDDVQRIVAVLNEDAAAVREAYETRQEDLKSKRRSVDPFPTMVVPGGLDNPIVQQLGVTNEETTPSFAMIRPDGSVAVMLNGQSSGAMQNVIEWHDEKAVEDALARGDLKEAKRIAFAHAPVEQVAPPDAPKHWKPKAIGTTHLRARAKVYLAMGEYEAALADAHAAYLVINSKAGHISMRTDDLEEIEQLKAEIQSKLQPTDATP